MWTVTLVLAICLPAMARYTDKRWFSCRVAAESIKCAVWRYAVRVAPFGGDDAAARQRFASAVSDIVNAREFKTAYLASHRDPEGQLITNRMATLRSTSFERRRRLYVQCRVLDQKRWYAKRARQNAKRESAYRWFSIIAPILAIVAISFPHEFDGFSLVAAVPFIMTTVAAATAWAQTLRYGELATSYSHVYHELTRQEETVSNCHECDFDEAVDQVEATISREHSTWLVRRQIS